MSQNASKKFKSIEYKPQQKTDNRQQVKQISPEKIPIIEGKNQEGKI